jgi:hypothetical protein
VRHQLSSLSKVFFVLFILVNAARTSWGDDRHLLDEPTALGHKTISLKDQFEKIRAADFWSESGHDSLANFCGNLIPKLTENAREFFLNQNGYQPKDLAQMVDFLAREHIMLNPKNEGDLRMLYDLKEQLKANLLVENYDGLQILFDHAAGANDMTSLRGIMTRAAQAAIRREIRLNKDTVDYFKGLGRNAHEALSLANKIRETTNLLKSTADASEKKSARDWLKLMYSQLVEANGLTVPMGPRVDQAVRDLMTPNARGPLSPEEKKLAVAENRQTYTGYREDLTKASHGDEAATARLRKNYPNLLSFGMSLDKGPQQKFRPLIVSAAMGPGKLLSPASNGIKPVYEWKIPISVGANQNLQGGNLTFGAPDSPLSPSARSDQIIVIRAASQEEAAQKMMKFNHEGKYDDTFAYVRTRSPEFEPVVEDHSPVGPAMGTLVTGLGEAASGKTGQGITRILSAISKAQKEANRHVTLDDDGNLRYERTWDELRREAITASTLLRSHLAQAEFERFVTSMGQVKDEGLRMIAVNLRKQMITEATPYVGSLTPAQALTGLRQHRYPTMLLITKRNSEGNAVQVPVSTASPEGILALAAVTSTTGSVGVSTASAH